MTEKRPRQSQVSFPTPLGMVCVARGTRNGTSPELHARLENAVHKRGMTLGTHILVPEVPYRPLQVLHTGHVTVRLWGAAWLGCSTGVLTHTMYPVWEPLEPCGSGVGKTDAARGG